MTLSNGTRLGPYELSGLIGAGGMGEVYRARDTRLGREVAVKVLPASLAADHDRLRRFEQEARAASVLSHPGIVVVFDIGTHEGIPYVVLELLEGETLREALAGGAFQVRRAVDLATQLAHGLAAAHEKGIVHRDLKPENVFLTRDGRVKVLDFGLARLTHPELESDVSQAETRTEAGAVLGTVGYMSPEQVRGVTAEAPADVFAFGAVLYEMLVGRRAFRGDSSVETMHAILKDEPPEMSPPAGGGALERIVRRCLEKDPVRRFGSARDLGFALEELAGGETAGALTAPTASVQTAPPAAPSATYGSTRRRVATAVALVLALAAAGLAASRLLRGSGAGTGRIDSLVVLPLANLSGDVSEEYFADGMTDELINTLSQIDSIRVISRTSAMRFKGSKESLPEIASHLRVRAVVEGSVRRAGRQVRISARLVDAATEKSLWSESFERDLGDVLALQSELARAITERVKSRVTPEEAAWLGRERPVDPRAYEEFLKGMHEWGKQDLAGYESAREHFEKAIAIDPRYAAAHLRLAGYYLASAFEGLRPPAEVMDSAERSAKRALELDPALPEAHLALAHVRLQYDWDPAAAAVERDLAARGHMTPDARWLAAILDRMQGRFPAAEAELSKALAEDPLSLQARLGLGAVYFWAGRPAAAAEQYRKALEVEPGAASAHELLADALALTEKRPEALEEQRKALKLVGLEDAAEALARDFVAGGWEVAQHGLARRRLVDLEEASKERYVAPIDFAGASTLLGDVDGAFRWLDKAVSERSGWVVSLRYDPQFASLRKDPRFAALIARIVPRPRPS